MSSKFLGVRMDRETLKIIKVAGKRQGMNLSDVVRKALAMWVVSISTGEEFRHSKPMRGYLRKVICRELIEQLERMEDE